MRDGDLARDPADLDGRCIDTLRMLAVDMVEAAGCGHPGLPLGAAPMAWTVWSRFLRHDPAQPDWADRDRFVLSAGHGSALLYGLLHLFGYGLSVDDLRSFRQLGSRTPGHPEHGHTPGVEVTTGPLGQGLANAVGMALAERMSAARFNTASDNPGAEIVDHRTFVLCSDGDLMEGVSGEASSLAGHLGLERLVVLWDDNRISIDGDTGLAFGEDVCGRYRAYGWTVHEVDDGNDIEAIAEAVHDSLAEPGRPGFIRVRTTIGYGAPTKAGSPAVHGAPLGPDETAALRRRLGWPEAPFVVPADVRARMSSLAKAGTAERADWDERFATWARQHPDLAVEWDRRVTQAVAAPVLDAVAGFEPGGKALATRSASGTVLGALSEAAPELVGGSADLAESTCTLLGGGPVRSGDYSGRHVHFGVREHAMAAILNGLALHGGFRPVGSTFLIFSDYARPALRLAALMGQPVVHVYTHYSIGLGEDGPTHQPVEHLASLRAIPGVAVLRPADANEVREAWGMALDRTAAPTAMALSRQALPVLPAGPAGWMAKTGARVVWANDAQPVVAIVATGSEVAVGMDAAELLAARGTPTIVVSMPWRERYFALDQADRDAILPPDLPVVVVEAGVAQGWEALAATGALVCLDRFGASGKGAEVQASLGFTAARVADLAHEAATASLTTGVPA
ncbi:transketolase [soil metagenome]